MRLEHSSEFERYVILSNYTKVFSGSYPNFLRLKELMSALNQMAAKNNNTYTYYGELYVSRLTNPEINKIQECLDNGVHNSSFEKLRYIFVDIGRMDF